MFTIFIAVCHAIVCEGDSLFASEIGDGDTVKLLELKWKPILDQIYFTISFSLRKNKLTKRVILSDLNKILDFLGFLVHVLLRDIIFLQRL